MSEHDQQPEPHDDRREERRPAPDQHDPTTEEDTASGGAPQEPDHRD